VQWDDVRDWFDPEWNGSAPDVVIRDTILDDWSLVVSLAAARAWQPEFHDEDQALPVPADLGVTFRPDREYRPMILMWPRPDVVINFWMFAQQSIDFDFDLHDVQDQAGLDWLCEFVRIIGRQLGKDVEIMPEASEDPFLIYDAAGFASLGCRDGHNGRHANGA
jgi:hypothetical protein